MDRENVERVVTAQKVLQLGGIVTCSATDDTVDDSRPRRNEARAWSNRDETGYDSGAEANGGPLAFESVVDDAPGHATDTGGKVRDDRSHYSAKVCTERGTGVETEPSDPQEDGSNDDVRHIVWSVVQLLGAVTSPFAQHVRVGQSSGARGNMHGSATSEIESAQTV